MKHSLKLTEKNPAELVALLKEKREELRTVRFASVGARIKDSNSAKKIRADIARVMTELGARKTAADA